VNNSFSTSCPQITQIPLAKKTPKRNSRTRSQKVKFRVVKKLSANTAFNAQVSSITLQDTSNVITVSIIAGTKRRAGTFLSPVKAKLYPKTPVTPNIGQWKIWSTNHMDKKESNYTSRFKSKKSWLLPKTSKARSRQWAMKINRMNLICLHIC